MTTELGVNEHHQAQVVNYMRFNRYQRGKRIRAVDMCFEELKESRLDETTYTIDEVTDMLDGLLSLVRSEVESELSNMAWTNILLLRQMFIQAEKWHLRLGADISELENRLQAYDRNLNFKDEPIILPDPLYVGWPVSGFQQLSAQHRLIFPKITREQVESYFLYRLAGDKQCSGDIKAMEKGTAILKGYRILACSVQIKEDIYLTGIVAASMKNQVTYNYKIKMEKSSGDPMNSHCECPSGKGPHGTCKHIAAVLLMLQDFVTTGEIEVERSCTDNLQMFHKPRYLYSGEPVEAEDIPTKKKDSYEFLEDPRPEKYRNLAGYNDYVRNAVTNFCSMTSADISFRYLYEKADIQTAVKDHDYCSLPFTEYWIEDAIKVTEMDIKEIEHATKKQRQCKSWYLKRQWRLTASHFGEICKMTPRRNKKKLCEQLLRNKALSSKPILHGIKYEAKALKQFEKRLGLKTKQSGLFISLHKPFLGASPDAIISNKEIVEVKCPYNRRNMKIKPGKNFSFLTYNDKREIVLKPHSTYYHQIQGQLYISRREVCYFVVYTFCDLFIQNIYIDHEFCNFSLVPKLELFYKKYFRPHIASSL